MENRFVFVKNDKTVSVHCKNIVFFESCGHYVTLHMNDGSTYSVRGTMYSIADSMDSKTFVRVHRGVIVNLQYIAKIKYREIILNSIWRTVPLSRSYREKALLSFDEFKKHKATALLC